MRAKQTIPANSLPIFIQKASWGNTHMPRFTFPSESHSGATRILSTRIPCGSHAGTTPRTLPRVKQAIHVRSLYTFLFGSQSGRTGVLPHKLLFRNQAGQTGTFLFRYHEGVEPTMSVDSNFNSPSVWKLSRANRYVSV